MAHAYMQRGWRLVMIVHPSPPSAQTSVYCRATRASFTDSYGDRDAAISINSHSCIYDWSLYIIMSPTEALHSLDHRKSRLARGHYVTANGVRNGLGIPSSYPTTLPQGESSLHILRLSYLHWPTSQHV